MYEGSIGEIALFAGNFAPRNWAFCHGQILPVSQNQALFSIIGARYGGDGISTFALPDMRNVVPMGPGHSQGKSSEVAQLQDLNATGSGGTPILGLNYCICLYGIFLMPG